MEEIDLDEVEYVIGYKDTAGIQKWCENEAAHMEDGWDWD